MQIVQFCHIYLLILLKTHCSMGPINSSDNNSNTKQEILFNTIINSTTENNKSTQQSPSSIPSPNWVRMISHSQTRKIVVNTKRTVKSSIPKQTFDFLNEYLSKNDKNKQILTDGLNSNGTINPLAKFLKLFNGNIQDIQNTDYGQKDLIPIITRVSTTTYSSQEIQNLNQTSIGGRYNVKPTQNNIIDKANIKTNTNNKVGVDQKIDNLDKKLNKSSSMSPEISKILNPYLSSSFQQMYYSRSPTVFPPIEGNTTVNSENVIRDIIISILPQLSLFGTLNGKIGKKFANSKNVTIGLNNNSDIQGKPDFQIKLNESLEQTRSLNDSFNIQNQYTIQTASHLLTTLAVYTDYFPSDLLIDGNQVMIPINSSKDATNKVINHNFDQSNDLKVSQNKVIDTRRIIISNMKHNPNVMVADNIKNLSNIKKNTSAQIIVNTTPLKNDMDSTPSKNSKSTIETMPMQSNNDTIRQKRDANTTNTANITNNTTNTQNTTNTTISTGIVNKQQIPIPKQNTSFNLSYKDYILKYKPQSLLKIQNGQINSDQLVYLQKIFQINTIKLIQNNQNSSSKFQMGYNKFTDISQKQFQQKRLNLLIPDDVTALVQIEFQNNKNKTNRGDKKQINWSCLQNEYIVEEKQWGINFIVAPFVAFQMNLAIYGRNVNLSLMEAVSCPPYHLGDAGFHVTGLEYEKSDGIGVALERNVLVEGSSYECNTKVYRQKAYLANKFKIDQYTRIPYGDCTSAISGLQVGTLVVGISAKEGLQFYQFGTYHIESPSSDRPIDVDLSVALVGYKTEKGYLVRNSWGSSWGQNGHAFVDQSTGVCGYAYNFTLPQTDSKARDSCPQ